MSNITVEFDNDTLILKIDPKVRIGRTSSGKNIMVATTHGYTDIGKGLKLSLNLITKEEK